MNENVRFLKKKKKKKDERKFESFNEKKIEKNMNENVNFWKKERK